MWWSRFISVFCCLFNAIVLAEDPQIEIKGHMSLESNPCSRLESCADCIRVPECAWCSKSSFHGPDKKPLPRCNSLQGHNDLGRFKCDENKLFQHRNDLQDLTSGSGFPGDGNKRERVPLLPERLSVKLRVNDPVTFTMKYRVVDYPLDLYYLMDGTYSMKDDKETLVSLGDAIGEKLRTLTSNFRLGFGTFVDKTTAPFAATTPNMMTYQFEEKCAKERDNCVKPYGFKNHLKLTTDTERFSAAVKNFALSGTSDVPEGGFDALMQVIVCERQIDWDEETRRLVLLATDAPFHYAGDGRLGGIYLPNDGGCHMDSNGEFYTHSLVHDYPSLSQINTKAKKHAVNIIFAVTADEIGDYKLLSEVVEGSKSTVLAKNSSNIVEVVEQQYKELISKVEVKDSFPSEFFKVTYASSCTEESYEMKERNVCKGLEQGTMVNFDVTIELVKCFPKKSDWKQSYRIYAVGVPAGIQVDVEMLCDCPCQSEEDPKAEKCNRHGAEICGLCECEENYFGEHCECSVAGKRVGKNDACKEGNSTQICSGRGNCICEQCSCIDSLRYSGPYCECDNSNCLITNKQICAGHGVCECGTCKCNPGWEGAGCDCSNDRSTCIEPGYDEECSGTGKCTCGKCECEGVYKGQYCERCIHESCPTECDRLKHCVQCKVHGTGIFSNPSDCDLNCYEYPITPVDVITASDATDSSEVTCKHEDPSDGCVYIFNYKYSRKGKKFTQIEAQKSKECPEEAPIVWIILGVAAIVVVIGLVLLCAYKAYHKMQVKREYMHFQQNREKEVWARENNPIYNSPVGNFQNPLYVSKE